MYALFPFMRELSPLCLTVSSGSVFQLNLFYTFRIWAVLTTYQIEGYPSRCANITICYLLSVVHNTVVQS